MTDLPKIADQLPELEDVIIDGRSVLGVFVSSAEGGKSRVVNNEDELERPACWPPSGSRWSAGST